MYFMAVAVFFLLTLTKVRERWLGTTLVSTARENVIRTFAFTTVRSQAGLALWSVHSC